MGALWVGHQFLDDINKKLHYYITRQNFVLGLLSREVIMKIYFGLKLNLYGLKS